MWSILKCSLNSSSLRLAKACFLSTAAVSVLTLPTEKEILAKSNLSEVCSKTMRALGVAEPYHRAPKELGPISYSEVIARMNKPTEAGKAVVLVGSRRQAFVLTAHSLYEISAPKNEFAQIRKLENFGDRTRPILPFSSEWQFMEVDVSRDGDRTLELFEKHSKEGSPSVFFGEREEIYNLGEMLGDIQSRFRVTEPRLSRKRLGRLMLPMSAGAIGLGITFWGYDYAQNQAVNYLLSQSPWTQKEVGMLPWVLATSDKFEKNDLIFEIYTQPSWSPGIEKIVLELLHDPSPDNRLAAIEMLEGRDLPIEFWEHFPEIISNDDPTLRIALAHTLWMMHEWPAEFWNQIPKLLQHPNPDVREATLIALQGQDSLPKEVWESVASLLERFTEGDPKNRLGHRFSNGMPETLTPELKERFRRLGYGVTP